MSNCCATCYHWDSNAKRDFSGRKPCKRLQSIGEHGALKGPEEGYFCDLYSDHKILFEETCEFKFVNLLSKEIDRNPDSVTRLTEAKLSNMLELVKDVKP